MVVGKISVVLYFNWGLRLYFPAVNVQGSSNCWLIFVNFCTGFFHETRAELLYVKFHSLIGIIERCIHYNFQHKIHDDSAVAFIILSEFRQWTVGVKA